MLSEKWNAFLRPLKKKGFKEEKVTTIGLYDIGKSHDPGIQQEPPWNRWQKSYGLGGNISMDWMAEIRGIRTHGRHGDRGRHHANARQDEGAAHASPLPTGGDALGGREGTPHREVLHGTAPDAACPPPGAPG